MVVIVEILRQEDHYEFQARLSYKVSHCLRKTRQTMKRNNSKDWAAIRVMSEPTLLTLGIFSSSLLLLDGEGLAYLAGGGWLFLFPENQL